ncbi:MAG: MiaB/RimO family radical SAM methylthiotransferase, partial [Intestinibacter sp.]
MDIDGDVIEGLPIKRDDTIKASVAIMNGCNNFCSYCIVPYVRGRERSREPKDILEEIRKLAKQGYKEVMLLGQNVNSYLRVEKEKGIFFEEYEGVNSFATLLRAVNKIEGIERIRFISPHPKDFTQDVIEAIRDCNKVCKLIHLPLQSGSSKILKDMNRKYTKEQYLNLVENMKEQIPNLTLSTDIIVGFPGETEEDFADTLNVVEKVNFEQVYMFIYSR